MKTSGGRQKALTLIMVVYIVAALSMLAFALAFRSRIAIRETSLLYERLQQDQLALAACTHACDLLAADDERVDCVHEPWSGWHELARVEGENWPTGEDEGPWRAHWKLMDEAAKINVNLVSPDLLLGLECLEETAVASILDWTDEDDVPNPDGAEDGYYAGLEPSYRCKNGPLDTIEELLLVKGISPSVYYGSDLLAEKATPTTEVLTASDDFSDEDSQFTPAGLCDLLTVYGDGKININTTSREVLAAIPLLSDLAVSEILSRQESTTRNFRSQEDIESTENFTPADKLSLMQVAKFNSNHFQLTIRVSQEGKPFWCEYTAMVERQEGTVRLLSWQRGSRIVFKDLTPLGADNDTNAYSQETKPWLLSNPY